MSLQLENMAQNDNDRFSIKMDMKTRRNKREKVAYMFLKVADQMGEVGRTSSFAPRLGTMITTTTRA